MLLFFFYFGNISAEDIIKKNSSRGDPFYSITSHRLHHKHLLALWPGVICNSASASDCQQLLPEGQREDNAELLAIRTLQEMRCWSVTRRVSFSCPKDVKATKLAVCQTFLNLNVRAVSVLSRAVANSYIQSIREEAGKEEWKDPYDSEK